MTTEQFKFRDSTAYIRAQVEVEQYFDKFKKYEGSVALKEFAELVRKAAYAECNAEYVQVEISPTGTPIEFTENGAIIYPPDTTLFAKKEQS